MQICNSFFYQKRDNRRVGYHFNVIKLPLAIVLYPDPVLRQAAAPVPAVDDQVRTVVADMLRLMHDAPGVGLAAPQVGLPWRLFVANHTGKPEDDRVYINPELFGPVGPQEPYEEGCLSLPSIRVEVTRPQGISIRAMDLDGKLFEESSNELLARIWQHEFDHLNGRLIIDKMSRLDRMLNTKKIKDLELDYGMQR